MTPPESGGPSKVAAALARILTLHGIDLVLDVGANTGQYAGRLRTLGYRGRIVSIEPLTDAHRQLAEAAAGDPLWTVGPRVALGDRDGTATLQRSAESDMSSFLPFRPEMATLLDSAAMCGEEIVPVHRLDGLFEQFAGPGDRVLLKSDTQGWDLAVLDGAAAVLDRITLVQIELALVPVYQGEPDWLVAVGRLAALGFSPILFSPGYFNRRLARLLSMDGVFARV